MIEQADVETASKLHDLAFATIDQNSQRQKLFIEDEIEQEKIKTDTLIEQAQRKLDHNNEIIEAENARLKARMDNEAVLLKAQHDTERIKPKADVADESRLQFAKRKRDLKKKVIEIEVKQSIVEENRTLNDGEVEGGWHM